MTVTQLKSHLHQLIDQSKDKELLSLMRDIMEWRRDSKPGDMWNSLTEEQKEEVLASYEGSKEPKNLIDNKDVMKRYRKWR